MNIRDRQPPIIPDAPDPEIEMISVPKEEFLGLLREMQSLCRAPGADKRIDVLRARGKLFNDQWRRALGAVEWCVQVPRDVR